MGRLSKNVFIYFIGNTINRFIGLVIMLVSTHILKDKKDLGFFSSISNFTNIFVTLFCLQIWMAVIRFVFSYDNIKNKLKVISTGYFVQIIGFSLYTLVLIIYSISKNYTIWFFLEMFLLSFSYSLNQGVQFSCRGLGKNRLYVISGVVGSFMQLFSNLVFMFILKMKSSALILSTAISYLSQGLFIEFFLKSIKHAKLTYVNTKILKKMLKYCIPSTLNFLAYWFNVSCYIWFIKIFQDDYEDIGILTPAYKMTSLIGFFVMSFNYAFQEYSFFMDKNKFKIKMYNNTLNSFFKFITSGTLLLLPVTSMFFSFLIGPSYTSAKALLPILFLASILDAIQIFLGSILQTEKMVITMFISQLVGLFVTTISMCILTNVIGLQAVGVSSFLCFFVVTVIRIKSLKPTVNLKLKLRYLIHFIPVYILTSFIYIKYEKIVNFLYSILLLIYFVICNKKLIFKLLYKLTLKDKNYNFRRNLKQ